MTYRYNILVFPLVLACLINLGLSVYLWLRRSTPGALPLLILLLAVAEWSATYALELLGADLATKFFWSRVEYFGILTLPLAWLNFALLFHQGEEVRKPRPWLWGLLLTVPLLTLVMIWTPALHPLIWTEIHLEASGPFIVMQARYGIGFWFFCLYIYTLFLYGSYLLLKVALRSNKWLRPQVIALLLAVFAPLLLNAMYLSGFTPFPDLDLGPFGFAITGLALSWSVLSQKFMGLLPIARSIILDSMLTGMIVLDEKDRIVDINPAAAKLLEDSDKRLLGAPFQRILEGWPELGVHLIGSPEESLSLEIQHKTAAEGRWFDLDLTPIHDPDNRVIGRLILLTDTTDSRQDQERLRVSEAELRALFASMNDVVLVIDRDGVYREIAPTNPGLLVKPPEELLGKSVQDVFPPDQAESFIKTMQQVLDTKQTAQIEYDLIVGSQTIRFETSISPMTEDSTLWVAHDITQRKRFESVQNALFRITQAAITTDGIDALYHSIHSILGELIPAENFFIALYDSASGLISFPYYIDQFDEQPSAPIKLQGLTGYVIRTGRPLLASREVFDRLVQQGEVEVVGTVGEGWLGAPLQLEGRIIGVMAVQSYTPEIHFNQEDLNLLEFVSTQVAQAIERKRMEEEIRNLSLTDELTGLYNRRGFTLLAEQEVKLAHRFKRNVLLFFGDVDDLKTINDTWGHAQGDLALMDVAAILKETFREADIPARLGGDEFVVLAPDSSMESVDVLKNRLQASLDARNQQRNQPWHLTLSVGIARFDPENPCSVSELLAQADGLMYQQKQSRKRKKP